MADWMRVLTLENEVEARLLQSVLEERGIPHIVTSFHDTALDGLYQLHKGWGCLQAPGEYSEEITGLYRDIGGGSRPNE